MAQMHVPILVNWDDIKEHMAKSDIVEVVRCKDCKHWDTTWENDWEKDYHYCPIIDGIRKGDWFCADAERRTDGSD